MPTRCSTWLIPALLLLLSLSSSVTHAQPIDFSEVDPADHTYEAWYLDTINGRPAGYWYNAMSVEDDKIISIYHEHRVESHGGEQSTHTHRVVWTETKDFKPIQVVLTTAAGSDEVTKTYRFTDGEVELTSEQNGKTFKQILPAVQGGYLTAAQSAIAYDIYYKQCKEKFTIPTLDPSVGLTPYDKNHQLVDKNFKTIQLADGSEAQAQRWVATYAIVPGFEMTSWINDEGEMFGLSYKVDAMMFESRLTDADVVDTKFDPPEMAGLSVVVPDRPIKQVDRQRKIVYELSYDAGGLEVTPATTGQQSVKALDTGKARVTVDLGTKPEALENDRPKDEHLANSIMIDHEDAAVRKLAKEAVAKLDKDASAIDIAKACKRFVTAHVDGVSLSVGDGSASEAARTGEGDCTECSVLLAAMLRVHGIPSRCVNGLVYSEDEFVGQKDVFVYHMWTQAWIQTEECNPEKGYWLDLDSAMWRYSAGHIALGVSAMGDDSQEDLLKLLPMQQNLQIKVIETTKKPPF